MASINAIISLTDRMTRPIQNIISSVNSLISVTERVATSMDNAFDVHTFDDTRRSLDQAQREIEEIVNSTNRANQSQRNYNNEVRSGVSSTNNLLNNIKSIAGAYIGIQGIKSLVNLSDNYSNTTARLNMIVDDGGSVEELQDKIFASAQESRALYSQTADVVAKLALRADDAFASNDETIQFAENLNKLFVIAGASQAETYSATLQLTQALGSGVLRGEELNAVFEAAPNVIQKIADYLGEPIGKIRTLASDGKITADIVKNAMLSATDEINTQFNDMPMTWSQVWNGIVNKVLYASQPLLNFISFLAKNWSVIQPIVLGIASAVGYYTLALLANSAAQGLSNTMTAISNVQALIKAKAILANVNAQWLAVNAEYALTVATAQATVAQSTFNTALMACPITWIILAIIVLITVIFVVIAAVNKARNETTSAIGFIAGIIAVAGAVILNIAIGVINAILQAVWAFVYPFLGIVEFILNVCNGGFDSFGDAVANLIGQIIGWFLSLGQVVTKIIDAIFGTDWTGGLENLKKNVVSWGKNEKAITLTGLTPKGGIDRINYGEAWDAGYKFGEGIDNKIKSTFGGGLDGIPFDSSGYGNIPSIAEDTNKIAGNTSDIADEVATTNENMEYLRKMAERDVVMRYVTPSINIDMSGMSNNIKNGMDIDGVIDHIVRKTSEAAEGMAEGV